MSKEKAINLLAIDELIKAVAFYDVDELAIENLTEREKALFYKYFEIHQENIVKLLHGIKKGV